MDASPGPAQPAPSPSPPGRPWHRHFETVGSVMAIVVGLAALYMSWDQGRVMRAEVAASVWPALQVDGFVNREADALLIGVKVQNAGVGPALVQGMTLRHNGRPLADLDAVAAAMPGSVEQRSVQTLSGRILAAGDSVAPFVFAIPAADGLDAVELLEELAAQWEIGVCYCSSLGDCWETNVDASVPRRVDQCPAASGRF
ncbi:MAG: hypothetical protein ACX93N_03510 [Pseudohaliea sp.]